MDLIPPHDPTCTRLIGVLRLSAQGIGGCAGGVGGVC